MGGRCVQSIHYNSGLCSMNLQSLSISQLSLEGQEEKNIDCINNSIFLNEIETKVLVWAELY